MFKIVLLIAIFGVNFSSQQMNICSEVEGYFPVPNDNTKYIHCDHGVGYLRNCSVGLVWNSLEKHCTFPVGHIEQVQRQQQRSLSNLVSQEQLLNNFAPQQPQQLFNAPVAPVSQIQQRLFNTVVPQQQQHQQQQQQLHQQRSVVNTPVQQQPRFKIRASQQHANSMVQPVEQPQQEVKLVQRSQLRLSQPSSSSSSSKHLSRSNQLNSDPMFIQQQIQKQQFLQNGQILGQQQQQPQQFLQPTSQIDQQQFLPNGQMLNQQPSNLNGQQPEQMFSFDDQQQQQQPTNQVLPSQNGQVMGQQLNHMSSIENAFQNLANLGSNNGDVSNRLQKLTTEGSVSSMNRIPVRQQNTNVQQQQQQQPIFSQTQQTPIVQKSKLLNTVMTSESQLPSRTVLLNTCKNVRCPADHDCVTKDDCPQCNPLCNPRGNIATAHLVPITCEFARCPTSFSCGMDQDSTLKCFSK